MDIETSKYRETDLSATKEINGFAVHLTIECKRSRSKQLILYCPPTLEKPKGRRFFQSLGLKAFPPRDWNDKNYKWTDVEAQLSLLPMFSESYPIARSFIVAHGDRIPDSSQEPGVDHDNTAIYNGLNSIIKYSISVSSDGYIETGFRTLFLYVLVWDGLMFRLSDGPTTDDASYDFDLTEADYGPLEFRYTIPIHKAFVEALGPVAAQFGDSYYIEVIRPEALERYLEAVANCINSVDKTKLAGWGEDWPDFTATAKKEPVPPQQGRE